ncbi:Unknown protein [Striga hermonthica]|uniref:Uncharacterized protein n=1 Tax=Striga hermonthica TaxID=68872 RepID=A0A9N7NJJ9_STRHE|nr:Unknown protein [Striga hermonthica]
MQKDESFSSVHDIKSNVADSSDPNIIVERDENAGTSLRTQFLSELGSQRGEEQETDVGAMQEVGSPTGHQIDRGTVTNLEGDGDLSADDLSLTSGDSKAADSGNIPSVDSSLADSAAKVVEEAYEGHRHSIDVCPIIDLETVSTTSSVAANKLIKSKMPSSSNEEKPVILNESDDVHASSTAQVNCASFGLSDTERLRQLKVGETENSLGSKQLDLSTVLDGSVVKLSELSGILRKLDEDEFRFLLMSGELPLEKAGDADKTKVHESVGCNEYDRLKEQLYVTCFLKDAFHLQLFEQQMLINEISAATSSLAEVRAENDIFAKEISQCKHELQEVVSEREKLLKQLLSSKAEVERFSAKINELQKQLEVAQDGLSTLSTELVDCRILAEVMQVENENLKRSLQVMAEERAKFSEKNEIILLENEGMKRELAQSKASLESLQTMLIADRLQLEEQNDSLVSENSKLLEDLAKYESKVKALEVENRNLDENLTVVSEGRKKLEEDKELMVNQIERMSKESMDCKDLILALEMEISNLNGKLMSVREERMRLEEENESIFSEYEKQYLELVGVKVSEAVLKADHNILKEVVSRVGQLTEENGTLGANLESHKLKLKELERKDYSSDSDETANRCVQNGIYTLRPKFWQSEDQLKSDTYDGSAGFMALKRKLEDAENVMHKLEKEIDSMHSHLNSMNRSSDTVVAPGVSKLIQAFESKHQADDEDPERSPSFEIRTSGDQYTVINMITENLRMLLKELTDDVENAIKSCTVMQKGPHATAGADSSEYNILQEHTDQVERENIEFMVLQEAMREHISHVVTKERELLSLWDVMLKQEMDMKSENGHLRETLNESQAKVSVLQSQLDGICRDIDEMVASISKQTQILQAEVLLSGRELFVEEKWNSVCAQVLQTAAVVDSTIKAFSANSSAGVGSNLDIAGLVATSVHGATKVIESLHGQLEDAHRECQEILDRNDMALRTLHTLYSELSGLVSGTILESAVVENQMMDLLNIDAFSTVLDELKQLSAERLQLQSDNTLLNSELASRALEADESDKKWVKYMLKLVEEIEQSVRLEGVIIDADAPSSRLESLIYVLIQKCKEADHNLSISTSLEMQLSELQGQVDHLHVVLVQYENENFILKQNLKSAEERGIALSRKTQERVAELEMSEQRALSLREKLSIAVTKGKGLISQRDSLKQSLAEMSKELEKSSQELLSKDARLHELETKLKVYSEAGERMEALESELSYIRNSATALRESFLLKDSVLQRIEEILEDLEMPDQFHSGNIIEKIEWLAKSIGGNPSSPLCNMDRRSLVQGGSYTDAGIVGPDGSKEDTQTNPFSIDDLRIRYEELQNKFHGLAEQNEMLEQSLLQRNNLVQLWEETLDKIDFPSLVRSMEPEYKIQWMGTAFSEVQNHCYSLQRRTDDLEALCRSLTAYVEDSQGRTSELVSTFQQSCVEKEILSMNLEILSHDNDDISKKTTDFEMRNENLQNEVIVLREQKLQLEEDVRRTEAAIGRVHELVNNALQESIPEDLVISGEGVEYFEKALRKLVEKYQTLSSEVRIIELPQTSSDFDEQDVVTLKKELEDSMGELMCLREDRDKYMEDNQSLLHKIEEMERKEKDMQDLLNQEEQKSTTFREKLNVAVRKGKSLVQQRDGMKQIIEELNAEVERLKSEFKHSEKAISEYEEQIKNLFTAQERVQVMESENASLRVHLAESERYLQEKEATWGSILVALNELDVGLTVNSGNPIEKLDGLSKCLDDLRARLDTHEQESRKSKRAAELLLAELNEVQERNDSLQDELVKAVHELSEVSKERDLSESAKNEILEHVSQLEGGQREMKSTIIDLQKELQEKDIQREKIVMELVTQIKESETKAKNYLHDLQEARAHLNDSQKQLDVMKEKCEGLEQRLKELQHHETNTVELAKQVNSLSAALESKTQETETLMQALEEQETEMEDLAEKLGGLEKDLQQKNQDLENLEASRAKALKKLSVTVSKFDELHYFSESLLVEVEKLQSQLQERDGEISFLRKEVTRCTNDALAVTHLSKHRSSGEVLDLLSWLDALLSRVQGHNSASDDLKNLPIDEYKDILEKKIMALISELENLHVVAQNNGMLLVEEKCKVKELAQKEQHLKNSLREKESELLMLQDEVESAKAAKPNTEIMEAEQMNNKWPSPATVVPQVRSLRKSNNDHVAIAIDTDHSSDRLEDDDDDDKAHGFKSLTTSKIVPRFTRPVSDLVDGLWVSCDRTLMRKPALRLGVIFYWAFLHAMLATFVV